MLRRIYRGESEARRTQIFSKRNGEEEFCGRPSQLMRAVQGTRPLQHPWPTPTTRPLGRGSSVGLVITGDRDVALAAAGFTSPGDLWPGQSQQTIS